MLGKIIAQNTSIKCLRNSGIAFFGAHILLRKKGGRAVVPQKGKGKKGTMEEGRTPKRDTKIAGTGS